MSNQDPIEFSEREKFILSYYRSPELSGSLRTRFFDLAMGLASIACVVMFATNGNAAWGFVGYALVTGRLYYLVVEAGRWTRDFRSIFTKYDAKLRELEKAQRSGDSGHEAAK